MVTQRQTIGIQDSFKLIKKSLSPFAPIKEAMVNAFESIKERQNQEPNLSPQIEIKLFFLTNVDLANQTEIVLDHIDIVDNGNGFNAESLERFERLADKSKKRNNRGTGKIQIFHRFREIAVDSIFEEAGIKHHLKLIHNIDDQVEKEEQDNVELPIRTTITLNGFYGDEKHYFITFLENPELLKNQIFRELILYLFLEKNSDLLIDIEIFKDGESISKDTLSPQEIPEPDSVKQVYLNTLGQPKINKTGNKEIIEWKIIDQTKSLTLRRFKLPISQADENGVYLCSKGIIVKKYNFSILTEDADFNGYRYLTSISGDILDNEDNLTHTADELNFSKKKQIEDQIKQMNLFNQNDEYIFLDEIEEKLDAALSSMYADLRELKEQKNHKIESVAKTYGISPELASAVNVKLSNTKDEITKKLFEAQAKTFALRSIEIQQSYEELVELETTQFDPTDTKYEEKFVQTSTKLMQLIPQQNQEELARYIIRRDMVVRILKLALKNELEIQKRNLAQKDAGRNARMDHEGIIHDLIFKRKTKDAPNDLWILNEEFVHFQGYSDIPLDKLEINGEKLLQDGLEIQASLQAMGVDLNSSLQWRPDIFLYPEEGKCVLIEFKAPEAEVSRYCDQIQKYAKIIANYSTKKITQFYGFLIGEQIDQLAIPDRYKKAPYGNYWFYPSEPINDIKTGMQCADIYQEIIPLSEIAKRAAIRNKSFATKLGISTTPFDD